LGVAATLRPAYSRSGISSINRLKLKPKAGRTLIVLANLVAIGIVTFFVANSSKTAVQANSLTADQAVAVNPLDQVSSADIALTVAQVNNLPETTAVANQAQTAAANVAMATTTDNVVAKPDVVQTALKSRANIVNYIALPGDSVTSLASRFGVTSDSIMWSNGLTSDSLTPGQHLAIPPVNGIVYIVKAGDTADSLAAKYHADKDQIIAYNDAEIGGLTPGEQIIIPSGVITTGPSLAGGGITGTLASVGAFPWGNGPIYGYNGYDYGYCTWYVATQIAVPSNWGNASSWAYYAGLSGWNVSSHPTPGAIAQTPYAAGGEGHVAIVDAVSPDGSLIEYRDMNGIAGWGRVGYSGWVPASTFVHYITP